MLDIARHPFPTARAQPSLTVHRLWLRVVVGEPGPQAEAGSVGAGPDPGVREGQRRPAGGAVQAGHGALGEECWMKGCVGATHPHSGKPTGRI